MKHLAIILSLAGAVSAAEFTPAPGAFPPPDAGHFLGGELVSIDYINRRGGLRLWGDGSPGFYSHAPQHRFALLPYATVSYHGGTADLVHVPLTTNLNGTFFAPPENDTLFPPKKKLDKFESPYKYCLLLEDDMSFYRRRGQAWKVESVDLDGEWPHIRATLVGPELEGGMKGTTNFTIDPSTRVWKGNGFAELSDVEPGQSVQMNFAWRPEWELLRYHAADVWLDEESMELAAGRQSQIHMRHTSMRGMPARIDKVEGDPGAKGTVTATLFSGQVPELYELVKKQVSAKGAARLAVVGPTLRTRHGDALHSGTFVGLKETGSPPPGSSGLQVRIDVSEIAEGIQPGGMLRIHPEGFTSNLIPSVERIRKTEAE